jgi:hypothetical protein
MREEDAAAQILITVQFAIGLRERSEHGSIKCIALCHTI